MKIPGVMPISRVLFSTLIVALSCAFSSAPASAQLVEDRSSMVGVLVEPTTTVVRPAVPVPGTPGTISTTPSPAQESPKPLPTLPSQTASSLVQELEDVRLQDSGQPRTIGGDMRSVAKAALKTAKDIARGIASGKPVADVLEDLLPKPVADVVVPAVRTASTFVFPIGLAAAVVAFLALQNRVDASDPKLSAAPFAHDDDVVEFI